MVGGCLILAALVLYFLLVKRIVPSRPAMQHIAVIFNTTVRVFDWAPHGNFALFDFFVSYGGRFEEARRGLSHYVGSNFNACLFFLSFLVLWGLINIRTYRLTALCVIFAVCYTRVHRLLILFSNLLFWLRGTDHGYTGVNFEDLVRIFRVLNPSISVFDTWNAFWVLRGCGRGFLCDWGRYFGASKILCMLSIIHRSCGCFCWRWGQIRGICWIYSRISVRLPRSHLTIWYATFTSCRSSFSWCCLYYRTTNFTLSHFRAEKIIVVIVVILKLMIELLVANNFWFSLASIWILCYIAHLFCTILFLLWNWIGRSATARNTWHAPNSICKVVGGISIGLSSSLVGMPRDGSTSLSSMTHDSVDNVSRQVVKRG